MSVKQKLVTAEAFWKMPEIPRKNLELVDGEVVEVTGANDLHHHIMVMVFDVVRDHVRMHDLGLVRPDGLPYVLHRNPDVVRIPDISFVAWERVPAGEAQERFWEGPPTLAVEVVSPNDPANEIHAKVRGYLDAGTRQVWVLWPPHAVNNGLRPGEHARPRPGGGASRRRGAARLPRPGGRPVRGSPPPIANVTARSQSRAVSQRIGLHLTEAGTQSPIITT